MSNQRQHLCIREAAAAVVAKSVWLRPAAILILGDDEAQSIIEPGASASDEALMRAARYVAAGILCGSSVVGRDCDWQRVRSYVVDRTAGPQQWAKDFERVTAAAEHRVREFAAVIHRLARELHTVGHCSGARLAELLAPVGPGWFTLGEAIATDPEAALPDPEWSHALHEAGHVVASAACGCTPCAAIVFAGGRGGRMWHSSATGEAGALISAAGEAAAHLAHKAGPPPQRRPIAIEAAPVTPGALACDTTSLDGWCVSRWVTAVLPAAQLPVRYAQICEHATRIVGANSDVVVRVARALLEQGILNSDTLRRLTAGVQKEGDV